MKTITILVSALICVFGLTGCVPAPGASGPGRPIAAYIADDVTKAEITHRAGGPVTEWAAEGDELDALRDWVSGGNTSFWIRRRIRETVTAARSMRLC